MRRDEFVRAHLPPPPGRLLEVGCGQGDLALSLAGAGYEVTAIDPNAPDGSIFRRVGIEDFAGPGPYDAVIASWSLHHVADLEVALDRITSLLAPDGILVLVEFAHERMRGRTAAWFHRQEQALATLGLARPVAESVDDWLRAWEVEHADLHSGAAIAEAIGKRFDERVLEWVPFLFEYAPDEALEPLERALIARGLIEATGFRYVGSPR